MVGVKRRGSGEGEEKEVVFFNSNGNFFKMNRKFGGWKDREQGKERESGVHEQPSLSSQRKWNWQDVDLCQESCSKESFAGK